MRWVGLVNPSAGRGRPLAERAAAALEAAGVVADLHVTESAEHLRTLVRHAVAAGADRFVAVGGDGTASLVVDAALDAGAVDPILGILPAGTGSDFVRTFGISQRLEEAATHLATGQTYHCDAVAVHGAWGVRHAINAVDAGILGATVERAERLSRRWGRLRYQIAFWLTLPRYRTTGAVRIETERRTWEGSAITVVAANGQFFGGGLNIAPKATLVDGVVDLQIFACSKWRALALHPKVARGVHLRDRSVIRMRAAEVRIEAEDPWPVEVDGDHLGTTPVRIEVRPGAFRLAI
ncbi:MAG: diacylglycerol kinase family lipid kinase [Acidimicrobiia bacterium]|nr:diacylglycerol kinase family lipid kinase [Acidimicrobiia bacterium]